MKSETAQKGYCLFISHCRDICGLPNPGVLAFDYEDEAKGSAVAILMKAGIYSLDTEGASAGRMWFDQVGDTFYTLDEVLSDFQGTLGASEYFHIYKLHELKKTAV